MNRVTKLSISALLLAMIAVPAWAAVWDVQVSNFQFQPRDIIIAQGDTVRWTNIQGTHNVFHTGQPSLFGRSVAPAPWMYEVVFNFPPGRYDYVCQPHQPDMAGSVTIQPQDVPEIRTPVANQLTLGQNYPNPFNAQTTIEFTVPTSSEVRLSVLNVLGQVVREIYHGNVAGGTHRVAFDAGDLSGGVYYYRLTSPAGSVVRTMHYIR